MKPTRVLLIGLDGLDWDRIRPLMEAAALPHLGRLAAGGVCGKLSGFHPIEHAPLWVSLATGSWPEVHGILTEDFPRQPASDGFVSSRWRVPGWWDCFQRAGSVGHVIAWPASTPFTLREGGTWLSDRFYELGSAPENHSGPKRPMMLPENRKPELKEFCWRPDEFIAADLEPFIPGVAGIDLRTDERPWRLACHLSPAISVNAAATFLLQGAWDFAAVHLPGLDNIIREFNHLSPPRMDETKTDDFLKYSHVIDNTLKLFDRFIGLLAELAGDQAVVVVCSLHGRPVGHGRIQLGPGEHAYHMETRCFPGFLVLSGPPFKRDEWVFGPQLLDVAPTVLAAASLPIPGSMRGRVLHEAFVKAPKVCFEPPPSPVDAIGAPVLDAIPSGTAEQNETEAVRVLVQGAHHLALHFLRRGSVEAALTILQDVSRIQPWRLRPWLDQLECLHALARYREALDLLNRLETKPLRGLKPRPGVVPKHLPELDLLRSLCQARQGETQAAEESLRAAQRAGVVLPDYQARIGDVFLAMRRWPEAADAFARCVEGNPGHAPAQMGLAKARYRRRQFAEAAAACLEVIALDPSATDAHLILGLAMGHLGRDAEAIRAFGNALHLCPGQLLAHRALASLYRRNSREALRARLHRSIAATLRRRFASRRPATGL